MSKKKTFCIKQRPPESTIHILHKYSKKGRDMNVDKPTQLINIWSDVMFSIKLLKTLKKTIIIEILRYLTEN